LVFLIYFAGTRLPEVPSRGSNPAPFWTVGNQILNRGGDYLGNLALARSGVLPFFILASMVVFFWTRLAYGALAAVIAVAFFSLTPVVLAFSLNAPCADDDVKVGLWFVMTAPRLHAPRWRQHADAHQWNRRA